MVTRFPGNTRIYAGDTEPFRREQPTGQKNLFKKNK